MTFHKGDIEWDGRYFRFKEGVYQNLKKVFSDKDVEDEIGKAERYLLYSPPKKNWTRFLCNWLNRANKKKNAPVNEMPQQYGARTANEPTDMKSTLKRMFGN